LSHAHFEGAILFGVQTGPASVVGANVAGAYLEGAGLEDINPENLSSCHGMWFDADTRFKKNWARLSEEECDEARHRWIGQGAVQSDVISR
jgi:uncharacterized protein YjbI with pentapeptide repeats